MSDFAARAERLLAMNRESNGRTDSERYDRDERRLEALALATLALVEQQRIANLQAFADGLANDIRAAEDTPTHLLDALKRIGDEVGRLLGVNDL